MNIIHLVLGKANPERMNGVNKVVDNLAKEQKALGYNVCVWGITPSPEEKTTERVYPLLLFKAHRNKLTIDNKLADAVKNVSSDTVFHLHGGFIPEFYLFTKLLNKNKLKYVFTPHGNYAANAIKKNSVVKKIYFDVFEKQILKTSKAVHCIGTGEWKDIDNLIKTHNKVLVPNGQNITLRPLEKKHAEPLFGFCGRVTRDQKGLDLLLEGFKAYVQDFEGKGNLWIIGEGDYLEEMKKLAYTYGLSDRVLFWGVRFGEEKLSLIAAMDSFFHTSRNEGLPTAVLEAAAMGIPCVVSEYTNMGEYIEENNAGIFLKNNTPLDITASMIKIADWKAEGVLTAKGINATQMIKKHFNWKKIAWNLVEVYKK